MFFMRLCWNWGPRPPARIERVRFIVLELGVLILSRASLLAWRRRASCYCCLWLKTLSMLPCFTKVDSAWISLEAAFVASVAGLFLLNLGVNAELELIEQSLVS